MVKGIKPEIVLPRIITQGLAELGIVLSARSVAALKRQIKVRGDDQLSIEIDDEGHPGLSESAIRETVEVFFKDLGLRVTKVCNRLRRTMPRLLDDFITSLADASFADGVNRRPDALRDSRRVHATLRRQIRALWGDGLDALEAQIGIVTEIAMRYAAQNDAKDTRSGWRTRSVLIRQHARACQIAREILLLLNNGYADGAHARWRTLHEVAAVACFIARYGDKAAYRYTLHETVDSARGAHTQLETWPALASDAKFVKNMKTLDRQRVKLVAKFGDAFSGDYGWAAPFLGGTRPTFRDIERAVQLDPVRPHYQLANLNIHAGSKGIAFRLGLGPLPNEVILAGPSPFGLEDPGRITSYSLMQITVTLLTYQCNIERLALARLVMKIADESTAGFRAGAEAVG